MRILVVEDEPTLAAQLQQALERAGYAVQLWLRMVSKAITRVR